jgi:ssDNA-binding Zn-finger/Zn-ribbon topoisomerase 1
MSDVRVQYNSSKPAQVGALAYTQGTDIHVAPGQEWCTAHEAWHVVQQKQGRVNLTIQLKDGVAVNDDQSLEHEADVMGAKALQMHRADHATFSPIAQATVLEAQDKGSKEASEAPGAAIGAFWEKGHLNFLSSSESQLVIQRVKGNCPVCSTDNVDGITTNCCKNPVFVCDNCISSNYHALLKDPLGPGKPVKCAYCSKEIDPHVYDGKLGAEVIERLDRISKMRDEVVDAVELPSLEIALAGGFKCPQCRIPIAYGGGCDVMVCPKCSKNFNCTGGEANVHSSDMKQFFAAVNNFSEATAKGQFIDLARQFPLPWTAMRFDELYRTVEDAFGRGDKDAVEGLIEKILHPEWAGLKTFLARHYISSGIDYDACRKYTTLSDLIKYLTGKVSQDDLEKLNVLDQYEKKNAGLLPFQKQRERNRLIGPLDVNLKSILRNILPS